MVNPVHCEYIQGGKDQPVHRVKSGQTYDFSPENRESHIISLKIMENENLNVELISSFKEVNEVTEVNEATEVTKVAT